MPHSPHEHTHRSHYIVKDVARRRSKRLRERLKRRKRRKRQQKLQLQQQEQQQRRQRREKRRLKRRVLRQQSSMWLTAALHALGAIKFGFASWGEVESIVVSITQGELTRASGHAGARVVHAACARSPARSPRGRTARAPPTACRPTRRRSAARCVPRRPPLIATTCPRPPSRPIGGRAASHSSRRGPPRPPKRGACSRGTRGRRRRRARRP